MKIWSGAVVGTVMVITVGCICFLFGRHVEDVWRTKQFTTMQQKYETLHGENKAQKQELESLKLQVAGQPANQPNQPASPAGATSESQTAQPATNVADSQQTHQNSLQNDPFLYDRDYLLEAFRSVHDTGTGMNYTAEQLAEMMKKPEQRDYKQVLGQFVRNELGKEIESFQTISQTVNPRTILVTMTDHTYYKFELKQRHDRADIWTVERYMDFYLNGNVETSNRYRLLKAENAPPQVKQWAAKVLQSPEWKTEYQRMGEKTYVLIKTSGSSTDSVELEDILYGPEEAHITYQAFDYAKDYDPSLINDYLLIELDYEANAGVNFYKSLSISK